MTEHRVSMEPQPFCSYCGHAPGGPDKVRVVDGVRLEYPEGIHAHHVDGHHQGPVIYICSSCHMRHHQVAKLQIEYVDGAWYAGPRGGHLKKLVTAKEWDH